MSLALNGTDGVTYNDGTLQSSAPVGKNLIINGDMRIAQRATSVAGLTGTAYSTVDRFQTVISSLGTWTESQSTDAPAGFSSSLKFECTTANASPAAGSSILTNHRIEGNTLPSLAFGTASAKSVTLSFWVKSNKIGTYAVGFRNIDNGRAIGGNYTIDSADTWEQKAFTFEGDTVSGFNIDNTVAANVEWFFGAGTDFTTGTMPTTWATTVTANRAAGQTVNLADSTSNYINITGVQLEVGTTATDFENLQYGQQLALCQRYYQKETTTRPGYTPTTTDTNRHQQLWWKVEMRAAPTITATWAAGSNNVGANTTTGAWIYSAVGDTTTGRNLNSWNASAEL